MCATVSQSIDSDTQSLSSSIYQSACASQGEDFMPSNAVVPTTLRHPLLNGKGAKKLKKYYKKQSVLLENYNNDQEQIEEFRRKRSNISRVTISEEGEIGSEIIVESTKSAFVRTEKCENEPIRLVGDVSAGCADEEKGFLAKAEHYEDEDGESNAAKRLATITLCVNVLLMIAKAAASRISGSMSIVSSLIDSVVDITSGLLIFLTSKAIKKRDPYDYPRGRTRLEPISLICISVIMGFASAQMLVETVKNVVNDDLEVTMSYSSAAIMLSTIVVKGILLAICKRFPSDPSVAVLAMDHRNDCLSNSVALICSAFTPLPETGVTFFGTPGWKYLDPIGATFVCLYIINTWVRTGREHIFILAGRSADSDFINRIIKACIDHDPRIQHIDTVHVYHYGMKFLVEVDVVMDEHMPLREAHDIGESLQTCIESLEDVERAFVHADYEYGHSPKDEHKVV